jgi:two-component system OmpR family response regulator
MPILLLTNDPKAFDRTEIYEAGADGYIEKPYCYRELISHMRTLVRRSAPLRGTKYIAGDLILDCESQEAYIGKKNVYLTPKEFLILELLLRNKGRVVSRGMIMEHVWSTDANPFSKTIETHILNLRRKVDVKRDKLIHAIPGRGYKIAE